MADLNESPIPSGDDEPSSSGCLACLTVVIVIIVVIVAIVAIWWIIAGVRSIGGISMKRHTLGIALLYRTRDLLRARLAWRLNVVRKKMKVCGESYGPAGASRRSGLVQG